MEIQVFLRKGGKQLAEVSSGRGHEPVNDGIHGFKVFRILGKPDVSRLVLRVLQRRQLCSGKKLQRRGNGQLHKHVPCGEHFKDTAEIV